MSARYAVRRSLTDGGEVMWWLVNEATGEKVFSSVFRDSIAHLADGLNARAAARAVARSEAGCWA